MAFNAHQLGQDKPYRYADGLRMDEPREDGFRCLQVSELVEDGWTQDEAGYWHRPLSPAHRESLGRLREGGFPVVRRGADGLGAPGPTQMSLEGF